ncbi:MAG: hypothetical protein ACYDCO_17340 [Armatimonadota bacterium]
MARMLWIFRRLYLWLIGLALLATLAGLWWQRMPHQCRLITRISGPEYAPPFTVTAQGLVHYTSGKHEGKPATLIESLDWSGKRRWSVVIPSGYSPRHSKGVIGGYYPLEYVPVWKYHYSQPLSSNGRWMVGSVKQRKEVRILSWHDGRLQTDLTLPLPYQDAIQLRILDNGRIYCWYGDMLSVIEGNTVIASNPNLPQRIQTQLSLADAGRVFPPGYKTKEIAIDRVLAPDASFVFGNLAIPEIDNKNTKSSWPGIWYSTPGFEYDKLVIKDNTIHLSREYTILRPVQTYGGLSFIHGNEFTDYDAWPIGDGLIVCRGGAVYGKNGQLLPMSGWYSCSKAPWPQYFDREIIQEILQYKGEIGIYRAENPLRVLSPSTGETWPLTRQGGRILDMKIYTASVSRSGQYALLLAHLVESPSPELQPLLNQLPFVDRLVRKRLDREGLFVYEKPGRLRAYLRLPSRSSIRVDGHDYEIIDTTLSPDGHHIMVRARIDEKREEYFIYKW